jgi:hypothetical protein
MKHIEARLFYESALGKRISDVQWWRLRTALNKQGIALTQSNLKWIAEIKKVLPHASLESGLLIAFSNAEKLLGDTKEVQGEFFLQQLQKAGIYIHPSTLSRWFKPLGGFRKKRFYPTEKLHSISISAYIHKVKLAQNQASKQIQKV